ncbi:MAG: DUF3656 domain-containing protein [Eubacteriales bacterium]|nr:DUF3656 domain-containing protein [Eubacteriales bacterium]
MNQQVELLAPAGSYEAFLAAIGGGADAVYAGGGMFGARAYAKNFSQEELLRAIDKAHLHGKKLYLTVNTLVKNRELKEQLYDYMVPFYEAGLDAAIVQDYGVFSFLRKQFPELPLHASTQMTVTGPGGMRFLEKEGAVRVVPARELSLEELSAMHQASPIEIETFIHGALCYSYSGQCLMSSLLGGRSGNRGRCAQPCRLPYQTSMDGSSYRGKKGLCPLSMKDICTLDILPEIVGAGVTSLKIEGRMKQPGYTAGVTSIYRKYLDLLLEKGRSGYRVDPEDRKYLLELFSRGGSCTGYYQMGNGREMMAFTNEKKTGEANGKITEIKEKIYGNLILIPGSPVILRVRKGEQEVSVSKGEVQYAQKQPMEEERVRLQMEKLGETCFSWERLDITMEGSVFVPMGLLNQVRREALAELEHGLTEACHRRAPEPVVSWREPKNRRAGRPIPVYASCQDVSTARALLEAEGLFGLYLPYDVMDALWDTGLSREKELYLALPHITRGEAPWGFWSQVRSWMDQGMKGLLIRNLEAFAMAWEEGLGKACVLDHSMYTWNDEALAFWREKGILRDTIPLELNEKELRYRDNRGSEMLVYGYLPLMHSAQCVRKNLYGCDRKEGRAYLKDRYGKEFPSICCCDPWKTGNTGKDGHCYNIIYNTIPYGLYKEWEQVMDLGPAAIRLSFTLESPREAKELLLDFLRVYHGEDTPKDRAFTKGHFKRGAE